MFCGKCGAEIPDNAEFCSSCGSPIQASNVGGVPQASVMPQGNVMPQMGAMVPQAGVMMPQVPVKKKHTGLIIAVAMALVLAVAALVIFLVIKPAGGPTAMDAANEYMTAMCKGDTSTMIDYLQDDMMQNIMFSMMILKDYRNDIDDGAELDYTLDDCEKLDEDDYAWLKAMLAQGYNLKENKIQDIVTVSGKYHIDYNDKDRGDKYVPVKLTFMKYDKKWYIINYEESSDLDDSIYYKF
jgi:hypothetical protein